MEKNVSYTEHLYTRFKPFFYGILLLTVVPEIP